MKLVDRNKAWTDHFNRRMVIISYASGLFLPSTDSGGVQADTSGIKFA